MGIRELFRLIDSDYDRLFEYYHLKRSFFNTLKIMLTMSSTAVVLYRLTRFFYLNKLVFIARFFYLLNIFLTGAELLPQADIGEGFFLNHTVATVITCKVGRNCTVFGQAGLGGDPTNSNDVGAGPGLAVIKDNVTIGFGAKVLGPVVIGNNVTILAGSLVIKSVPDGVTVGGIPARKIVHVKRQVE